MMIRRFLPFLICLPLAAACACAKNAAPDASQIAAGLVISQRDFAQSYRLSCEKNRDCALPLVCNRGLCDIPPSISGRADGQTPRLVFKTAGAEQSVYLEIAADDYARQKGMMNRKTCDPQWGMLFIFPNEARRSFWMRNTYVPLDIIFIDRFGKVSNFYQNAKPLDEGPRYTSDKRARYVLELPGGSIARYGIDASTTFDVAPFNAVKAE